jgi:hypothetical protein
VHRAALAAAQPRDLAVQFCHHGARVAAERQHIGVVAIVPQHAVFRAQVVDKAQRERFLPNIEVQIAADFVLAVRLVAVFLKATDEEHLLV